MRHHGPENATAGARNRVVHDSAASGLVGSKNANSLSLAQPRTPLAVKNVQPQADERDAADSWEQSQTSTERMTANAKLIMDLAGGKTGTLASAFKGKEREATPYARGTGVPAESSQAVTSTRPMKSQRFGFLSNTSVPPRKQSKTADSETAATSKTPHLKPASHQNQHQHQHQGGPTLQDGLSPQQQTDRAANISIPSASIAVSATTSLSRLSGAANLLNTIRTPTKRAIPREDTHSRNLVDDIVTDGGSPPHKRSRSSKYDSSGTHQGSTTGIASGFGKIAFGDGAEDGVSLHRDVRKSAQKQTEQPATPINQPKAPAQVSAIKNKAVTTQRIDKQSRMSAQERATREASKREQTSIWREKYRKVFPSFIFCLDGFDDKEAAGLRAAIARCGAQFEPFFDKRCTHLITARKSLPTPATKASAAQQSPSSRQNQVRLSNGSSQRGDRLGPKPLPPLPPSKRSAPHKAKHEPLHSDRNPFDDQPSVSATNDHVVLKAQEWGKKIWTLEKFWNIYDILLGVEQQGKGHADTSKRDLARLLEHEKVHGTLERDLHAPREKMHYFEEGSVYVLVEDATLEHRTIMKYEFKPLRHPDDDPEWPVLRGRYEGRCPFAKVERRSKPRAQRERAERELSHTPGPPASRSVRETASPAPSMQREGTQRGASPYQLASGNSVSVASHMTSVAGTGSQASFAGTQGLHGLTPQDRRVWELTRRSVLAKEHTTCIPSPAANGDPHGAKIRAVLGISNVDGAVNSPSQQRFAVTPASAMHRSVSAQSALAAQRAEPSTKVSIPRSVSQQHILPRSQHLEPPAATQKHIKPVPLPQGQGNAPVAKEDKDKKPYCENCKTTFNDFEEHIRSRSHRNFALDNSNFVGIDALIQRVARPLLPWTQDVNFAEQLGIEVALLGPGGLSESELFDLMEAQQGARSADDDLIDYDDEVDEDGSIHSEDDGQSFDSHGTDAPQSLLIQSLGAGRTVQMDRDARGSLEKQTCQQTSRAQASRSRAATPAATGLFQNPFAGVESTSTDGDGAAEQTLEWINGSIVGEDDDSYRDEDERNQTGIITPGTSPDAEFRAQRGRDILKAKQTQAMLPNRAHHNQPLDDEIDLSLHELIDFGDDDDNKGSMEPKDKVVLPRQSAQISLANSIANKRAALGLDRSVPAHCPIARAGAGL